MMCRVPGVVIAVPILILSGMSAFAAVPPAKFPEAFNTQQPGEEFVDPETSRKSFQMPFGFRATVFAAEPDVHQPIAMATDERGRLWVIENYTYAERVTNFETRLRDRILIFEDIDGDGRFDQRTVFWDKGSKITSVEVGFGGVWVLAAPQLLFIPDRNRDDRPDGEPVVLLDGWDADDVRHNIVNGLRWGPDGWLYGRHGILSTSYVGQPGDALVQRTKINCGIWRYHPTRRKFEVVAEGTTNSWGMDWDAHGQMFFINTVIGHLWHVIPGAFYERMYGEHFSPYVYDLIDQTADHIHWDTSEKWSDLKSKGLSDTTDHAGGGHAHCGMMIYLGDNWPERYRGGVFTLNLHGRRVNHDTLRRKGATFTGEHLPDPIRVGDPWFRGIELLYGPDGGVFIADWSDIGECHENDGVHRTSGRIYKVTFQGDDRQKSSPSRAKPPLDLAKLSNDKLVELQKHGNEWFPRQARRVLQERSADGKDLNDAERMLFKLFESSTEITQKLRAMWCLYSIGALDAKWLREQLHHENEHVRLWCVQLLCDVDLLADEAINSLTELAEKESSGLVLVYLASAMRKMPADKRFALAARLCMHKEFAGDPVYSRMVWYGLMPVAASLPEKSIALIAGSHLPLVRRNLTRRVTSEIRSNPETVNSLVALLETGDESLRHAVLEGMALALRGRLKVEAPLNWKRVSARLLADRDEETVGFARELAVVFGDGPAIEQLLKIVPSSGYTLAVRRNTIRSLVNGRVNEVVPLLQQLLKQRDLAPEAIRGLAAFDHPRTAGLIVEHYGVLYRRSREEAISTLVSRPSYAKVLLEAVRSGKIPRDDVSPFQIRQMNSFADRAIAKSLNELWPAYQQTSEDKAKMIADYQKLLTPAYLSGADRSQGRVLYEKSCAACHRLFGKGGDVGPDLTGGQRQNLYYLLENIVAPSATLPNNYRMSIVQTANGRVFNGIVIQKNEATLTLRTPKESVVLPREDIELMRESEISLMPERQLEVLKPEQVRDLIGYLQSPGQVPLPDKK